MSLDRLVYLLSGNWDETDVLHVAADLFWNFPENLSCEVSSLHSFIELHKLYDISGTFVASEISENLTIPIKFLHRGEICVADTNYDHRCWSM